MAIAIRFTEPFHLFVEIDFFFLILCLLILVVMHANGLVSLIDLLRAKFLVAGFIHNSENFQKSVLLLRWHEFQCYDGSCSLANFIVDIMSLFELNEVLKALLVLRILSDLNQLLLSLDIEPLVLQSLLTIWPLVGVMEQKVSDELHVVFLFSGQFIIFVDFLVHMIEQLPLLV